MPCAPKSALVIGSDGFLGRHAVRILRARGWEVATIGRADGDLAEPGVADALFAQAPKVERIFHLVTRQRTGAAQNSIQGELLAQNSRIHLQLLEAWRTRQPQAKLISTGSSCAFPEVDRPIAEGDFQSGPMHNSVRGYGLAKQLLAVGSETYASQYGLSYLHLFLATVYGPGDYESPDRTHFMTAMIQRARRERDADAAAFTVWGDPDTVRDLLYVNDQIEAILAADEAFNNERLNCSGNAPVTIDVCARAILDALKWPAEIVYLPNTFRGTRFKTLDASRFLAGVEWRPRVDLAKGIAAVLRSDERADGMG